MHTGYTLIVLRRFSVKVGLGSQIFDGFVDFLLICDIILNFRTSFVREDGNLESKSKVVSS